MLADVMTFSGKIMGIGRYGVAGHKESILARMAFEEIKKHMVDAAVINAKDNLLGPIENIMMNQVAPIGTGRFKLKARIGKRKK